MAYRRIDPQTVADEFGNTMWMPDLSVQQPMGDGVMGSPVPLGNNPMDIEWPAAPAAQDFWPHPEGAPQIPFTPPDMSDPGNALMDPNAAREAKPFPNEVQPSRQWDAYGNELGRPLGEPDAISGPTGTGPAPSFSAAAPSPPPDPELAAQGEAHSAELNAANAAFEASQAEAQRKVEAQERSVLEWDQQNLVNQKRYEVAAQKADQETAEWLKENQAAANQKADPSRFWSTRSGWSKTLWVISLLMSSISAGADQSKNITLKMLDDEVAQDLALQKDEMARRMEAVRMKGGALDKRQARDMSRVGDDEAAAWQRWSAIERTAMAKASIPGPEQRRAAAAMVAQHAAEQKAVWMEKRANRNHEDWRIKVDQDLEREKQRKQLGLGYSQLGEQRAARIADDKRQDTQQLIGVAQDTMDRADKYALAAITASGKAGAAGGIEAKDLDTLPKDSGFVIRDPKSGKTTELRVRKERYKDVATAAQSATDRGVALQNFRKAFKNTDGTARVFNNDAEMESAYIAAMAPMAREINGGGVMTEGDMARGGVNLMGMDKASFLAKAKGPDKAEILALLDKQIASFPANAARDVAIAAGISTGDSGIHFTPDESLGWTDPVKLTTEEARVTVGVKTPAAARPTTPDEYRKARATDQAIRPGVGLPPLPPDLAQAIEDYESIAKTATAEAATEAAENTKGKISEWAAKNPGNLEAAQDARIRVEAAKDDFVAKNRDALKILRVELEQLAGSDAKKAAANIEPWALRHGLKLSTAEIAELVKEAEARAKKLKGAR